MRIFLIPLLVASALVPAAALAQEAGMRGHRSEGERDGSSGDRPQRAKPAERSGGNERPVRVERTERPARTESNIQQVQSVEPAQPIRGVEHGQAVEPIRQVKHVRGVESDQASQPVQRVRRAERNNDGFAVRRVPRETQTSPDTEVEAQRDGDRDGFNGLHDRIVEQGDQKDNHHRWNGDWRHDKRYDWQNYRSRHSSLYRFGRYYDPYGWGYRRFSIGLNLWPSYYGSGFWLNDPWQYRLPPAYGPYRWVRYYDDALLVNIYTGQVVDVIHGFFW